MSQAKPLSDHDLICRDCGASNEPGASECWLCHRRDWRGPLGVPTSPKSAPSPLSDDVESLMRTLAWATVGLVMLGGLALAPGVAFAILLLVVPPLVGAEWIVHRRRNRGLPTSTTRLILWVLVLTILLPILMYTALIIGAILYCMVNPPGSFH